MPLNYLVPIVVDSLAADSLKVSEMPSLPGLFLRMILGLIFIAILIYSIAFIYKRISNKGFFNSDIDARLLGNFGLNSKQAIYITYILGEIYILASSGTELNLIDKISDKEKIKDILASQENKGLNFENIFKKIKISDKK